MAVRKAFEAGNDIIVFRYNHDEEKRVIEKVIHLTKIGKIKENRINKAVNRIIKIKEKLINYIFNTIYIYSRY